MKVCKSHWSMCIHAIKNAGTWSLVAHGAAHAAQKMEAMQEGRDFEPLLAINEYLMKEAISSLGVEVLGLTGPAENDGHHCPICLFEQTAVSFHTVQFLSHTAQVMAEHCREKGFLKV